MRVRRLVDNDYTFGQGVGNICTDNEAVKQRTATRLRLLLGEWFLDTSAGLPYLQKIVEKPTDLPFAEAVIKQKILGTLGISTIDSFELLYDSSTRIMSVNCAVTTLYDLGLTPVDIQVTIP